MFCDHCGSPVDPGDKYCMKCGAGLSAVSGPPAHDPPAAVTAGKEDLLREIEQAIAENHRLSASRGTKSDLEIKGLLADAKWLLGKRKVEFRARLEAKEAEHTVVYWEMIKEVGWGMPTFGGFKVESYKTDLKTRSGSVREVGYGPQGKMIDYDWDYAQTRRVVEGIANARGWKFTVVLRPSKATH